ncbi:MAG: hypothetical protein ABIQ30_10470 [Devosia sp.]
MVDDNLDRPTHRDADRSTPELSSQLANGPPRASEIRPLSSADISAVAALYHKIFLNPARPAPRSLSHHIEQQFLPNQTGAAASLVYVRDGVVAGFVGAMPLSMVIDDRTVRAVTIGSFMVDGQSIDPLGGARLLRAMANGPQDVTISETASATSLTMWRSLRGTVLPGHSLDWLKVLSPTRYLTARLARRLPVARLAQPIAGAVDRAIARRPSGALGWRPLPTTVRAASHDSSVDETAAIIRDLSLVSRARPDWAGDTLEHRLEGASRKAVHGPMTCRAVTGPGGNPVGLFVYHAQPFGIGHVLQIMAQPGQAGYVVDQLFQYASSAGIAALSGRTDPALLDALLGRDCSFGNYSSTVVAARDKSLLVAMREGHSLITGLAGETWSPFSGHDLETP